MIYQAILIACLASAPTDCRTVEIYLVERMPVPVMIEAQTRSDVAGGSSGDGEAGLADRAGEGGLNG